MLGFCSKLMQAKGAGWTDAQISDALDIDPSTIEPVVLSGQCLDRRIGEEGTLRQEVVAWEAERNTQQIKVNWRFTTQDARIKLKRLYPVLEKEGA